MRILIGLVETAGYFNSLKKGFDELGVDCTFLDLSSHPFEYERRDFSNRFIDRVRRARSRMYSGSRPRLADRLWWDLGRFFLFVWALLKFEVFIFGYWSSFLNFRDLPILKFFRKRVIYVFFGSDSRPPYIDNAYRPPLSVEACIRVTREQKGRIRRIERYADEIVCYPLHTHLHERPVVNITAMGLPCEPPRPLSEGQLPARKRPVRVLHAPSVPEAKGTDRIREAVREVQARGHEVELIEVIGRPHRVVMEELARCDLVIDQLYSEVPAAKLAAEAMSLGKAVIVGGYAGKEIEDLFRSDELPPVCYCHPDRLRETLERLVLDESHRRELGEQARLFVESNWLAAKVARCFLDLAQGRVPAHRVYDPRGLRYLHGFGFAEARVRERIRAVVAKGGREALELPDKPELVEAFLRFAFPEDPPAEPGNLT